MTVSVPGPVVGHSSSRVDQVYTCYRCSQVPLSTALLVAQGMRPSPTADGLPIADGTADQNRRRLPNPGEYAER